MPVNKYMFDICIIIYLLYIMEWKSLLERFFYWVLGIWGGEILTIWTFFKAKKHSANIEHRLKLKLVWPVCTESIKLKLSGTGAMTPVRNEVFMKEHESSYFVGQWTFGGGAEFS